MFLFLFLLDIGGSSYNYKDQLAQAYCASKAIGLAEHTSAVRRNCDLVTSNQTCNDICVTGSTFATSIDARFPDARFSNFECTGAVWLMMDHPVLAPNPGPGQTDAGLLNMVTISYDNCENTDCGPSYCCCVAYFEPDG